MPRGIVANRAYLTGFVRTGMGKRHGDGTRVFGLSIARRWVREDGAPCRDGGVVSILAAEADVHPPGTRVCVIGRLIRAGVRGFGVRATEVHVLDQPTPR